MSALIAENGSPADDHLVLDVSVPKGTDPAILSSLRHGLEQAVSLLLTTGQARMLAQADQLAELRDEGLHFVTYERRPFRLLAPGEFDIWVSEQDWSTS